MAPNRRFFITGLPRSRTAWLASFFNYACIHCYHDGLLGCDSLAAYATKIDSTGYPTVGDSDSGLLAFAGGVRRLYPDAPFVVIARDPQAVQASLTRNALNMDMPSTLAYLAHATRLADMVLPFSELDNESSMKMLWQFCTSTPFPVQRWQDYRHRNIQVHVPTFKQRLADNTATLLQLALESDPLPHGTP